MAVRTPGGALQRGGSGEEPVARRPGLPGGGLRQPRDAAARPRLGARHPQGLLGRHPRRPGGRRCSCWPARSRSWICSRVGIHGWSFGGYTSALAVLKRPDVYRAAVAGAPVTDWRNYDTFYTERYLGLHRRARRHLREGVAAAARLPGLQAAAAPGARHDGRQRLSSSTRSSSPTRSSAPDARTTSSRSRGFTHMVADPGGAGVAVPADGGLLPRPISFPRRPAGGRASGGGPAKSPGTLKSPGRSPRAHTLPRRRLPPQRGRTFCACRPFGPRVTSNCTF